MDKQQIKARFFGAHIGCKVLIAKSPQFAGGIFALSEVSYSDIAGTSIFFLKEDGTPPRYDGGYEMSMMNVVNTTRLILRPLPSMTDEELTILSEILFPTHAKCKTGELLTFGIRSGKLNGMWMMRYTAISADYLRSINICVPFMGLDPIAEGWAILEKIPANAPQTTQEEEI